MNKSKILINESLIIKLKSMIHDIKYYMNLNANIYSELLENDYNPLCLSDDEVNELEEIRTRLKILTNKIQKREE